MELRHVSLSDVGLTVLGFGLSLWSLAGFLGAYSLPGY